MAYNASNGILQSGSSTYSSTPIPIHRYRACRYRQRSLLSIDPVMTGLINCNTGFYSIEHNSGAKKDCKNADTFAVGCLSVDSHQNHNFPSNTRRMTKKTTALIALFSEPDKTLDIAIISIPCINFTLEGKYVLFSLYHHLLLYQ